MLVIDSFSVILLVVPLYPLIRSIFKAISLSDIKSLIAFSTISQISYMFVAIHGASTLVSPFHIIIHALFKSLSFLFSGSPIHVQPNFQSIYKPQLRKKNNINIIGILLITFDSLSPWYSLSFIIERFIFNSMITFSYYRIVHSVIYIHWVNFITRSCWS